MAINRGSTNGVPQIFSVQHFCLHDGPGVRSLVFFKGCPLRCLWCQNPESWRSTPEVSFKQHLCIDCRSCVEVCPPRATLEPGRRDDRACVRCFTCADKCPSGALTRCGEKRTVESLRDELRPEYPFLRNTGGGVTLTGGEPTLWPGFGLRLAEALKQDGVHLTLETCGLFRLPGREGRAKAAEPSGPVWDFLSALDLILFDVKVFDDLDHRRMCGQSNLTIKRNLTLLAELAAQGRGPIVWARLPLIPGLTDRPANLQAWAEFLLGIGLPWLTVVPYHNLGETKRDWLGLEPGPDLTALTDEARDESAEVLRRAGLSVFAPGEEDWTAPRG